MCKIKSLIVFLFFFAACASAHTLTPNARVSLLTCAPGEELYARYGHTAIRIADDSLGIDWVFNYGIFDFDTEAFYWKFVRGETYYQLGVCPTNQFMAEYNYFHRPVSEQVLRLTWQQKEDLYVLLLHNSLPENRVYLYNFVFDNCATRPYELIKRVLGDTICSSYTGLTGQTFRSAIHHYTRPWSWGDLGINLIFGCRADAPMTTEQTMFLPEQLMLFMEQAVCPDGTPLIEESSIQPFVIKSTPWYATCWAGVLLLVMVLTAINLYDACRDKRSRWLDWVMIGVMNILLILVIFLRFFSIHPLVGFGWRLLILPVIYVGTRLIYWMRK